MPPKIPVRADALERLRDHVRNLIRDCKRETTEKERAIVPWLERLLEDDADPDPIRSITAHISSLRPGWERPMTAMEQHTFHGSLECLRSVTAEEWKLMRDFLGYTPRGGERLYQVRNRDRFLQAPMDTLGAAQEWVKTQRRTGPGIPAARRHDPEKERPDVSATDLLSELFKDAAWKE